MSCQVDEVIIKIVGETQFLYDTANPDFENAEMKKKKWEEISAEVSKLCNIEISASDVEQRWTILREMSSLEHAKNVKRRKIEKSEFIGNELVEASTAMAKAASSVVELLTKHVEAPQAQAKEEDEYGGFVAGLKASLKFVDEEDTLDCVIEMLQVAQRYQQRHPRN